MIAMAEAGLNAEGRMRGLALVRAKRIRRDDQTASWLVRSEGRLLQLCGVVPVVCAGLVAIEPRNLG